MPRDDQDDQHPVEEPLGTSAAGEPPVQDELENLREELRKDSERANDLAGRWQRTQADFINYKRRTEQEREQLVKSANMALIGRLLGLLDDFERAMATLPRELFALTWLEGIALIQRKMEFLLQQEGLTRIEALNKDFDPNVHEAVIVEEGVALHEGKVVAELQAGYKFHDRVLRSALVKVGRGTETAGKE